jgi:hypothetical protein
MESVSLVALAPSTSTTKQQLSEEIRELRIEIASLESTLAELRIAVNAERGKVIDLPARRVN